MDYAERHREYVRALEWGELLDGETWCLISRFPGAPTWQIRGRHASWEAARAHKRAIFRYAETGQLFARPVSAVAGIAFTDCLPLALGGDQSCSQCRMLRADVPAIVIDQLTYEHSSAPLELTM